MAGSEFEELDKAVASVLGTTPVSDDPTPDSAEEKTVEIPQTIPQPAAQPVVAPRPQGGARFMDVVHPDRIARPGRPLPASAPVQPAPAPVVEEKPADFTQPDPLDFHGFTPEEAPAPAVEEAPAEPAPEPLNTPFLPDAKVEKRPLGAFSDTPKPEEVPAPSPAVEDDKEASLPAELHTDLLSIEASEPLPVAASEPEPPVPSIVQQYQEKPNSDTKPSAAIYDTEAFHMPLNAGAKKKNNAFLIIWIAAVVVVGLGLGAAVYFVVLPLLG